ncbi:25737_t:CDS:2, partial [Racocetra persica]
LSREFYCQYYPYEQFKEFLSVDPALRIMYDNYDGLRSQNITTTELCINR